MFMDFLWLTQNVKGGLVKTYSSRLAFEILMCSRGAASQFPAHKLQADLATALFKTTRIQIPVTWPRMMVLTKCVTSLTVLPHQSTHSQLHRFRMFMAELLGYSRVQLECHESEL